MNIKINEEIGHHFKKFFHFYFIFFIIGIFFLSTRSVRNFYYVFVFIPFLIFFLKKENIKVLFDSKILKISILYVLVLVFSAFWAEGLTSIEFFNHLRKSALVIVFILCCLQILFLNKNVHLEKFFFIIIFFISICAIFSFIYFYLYLWNIDLNQRLISFGLLNNPITAGKAYAILFIPGFFILLSNKYVFFNKEKAILLFSLIFIFCFVLLTKSRGPIFSLLMSLFIGILISRPKFILFFFSFIIASISAVYFSGLFKFSSLMERGFSYRFDIWSQSLEIFMEKPLLGYGLGGDRPEIVLDIFSVQHSHNIFLSNMLDAGLLGLFLLLSLFGLLFYWSLEYFKKTKNATFFCMVLFSFLANLVDGKSLLVSPDYQWIGFWLPVGLCAFCELSLKHDKAANVCESA